MSHLKVDSASGQCRTPVAMIAHRSISIPLSKWPMLIAGNCRCIDEDGVRSIARSVLKDVTLSRAIYEQVNGLVLRLGLPRMHMISFENYLHAAEHLDHPSSLARALATGAKTVERIDLLVLNLMRLYDLGSAEIETIVTTIQSRLDVNRRL